MGLEYQVCYNGGAQGSKCTQSRFPLIGAIAPPPPAAGGNLKRYVKICENNRYPEKVCGVIDSVLNLGKGATCEIHFYYITSMSLLKLVTSRIS